MAKSKGFKVRFHLGQGQNYMHWRIEDTTSGDYVFFHPDKVMLQLVNAKLRNQKATAQKINAGAHKEVCAWIECSEVIICTDSTPFDGDRQISYNPRVAPHWVMDGQNIDGHQFYSLVTLGNKVYTR
jgi:hypothetical protein